MQPKLKAKLASAQSKGDAVLTISPAAVALPQTLQEASLTPPYTPDQMGAKVLEVDSDLSIESCQCFCCLSHMGNLAIRMYCTLSI